MISRSPFSDANRRELYRSAKKILRQQLLPRWQGTRSSLERIVRAALRGRRRDYLRRLIRVHAFAGMVAASIIAGGANAAPIELSDFTLPGNTAGFAVVGTGFRDFAGFSVSDAGDINGDGLADVIVGAYGRDPGGVDYAGAAFVIFGRTSAEPVDVDEIAAGTGGFIINGEPVRGYAGISVSSAGDVNGDGRDDLIIGASGADPNGVHSGRSYVVFGKANNTAVELSSIAAGTGGFAINGEAAYDYAGGSVSSAGDVNGDGRDDLIVGARFRNPGTGDTAGEAYVIFGKSTGTTVELSAVAAGTGGFAITGASFSERLGGSVSAAGDVNGDGLADVIVGGYGAFVDVVKGNAGRAYVVFGKTNGTIVPAADIVAGTGGFAMTGEVNADRAGYSVSSAGDVNGDGLDDVVVGAMFASPNGVGSGKSYVVFGKTGTTEVDLADVAAGTGGFAINGESELDYSGISVSGAGDVNGDGRADVIVGARDAYGNSSKAGRAYVVFGKSGGGAVQLSNVVNDAGGFAMLGEGFASNAGRGVSNAGDVNGDGMDDLLVGAYRFNNPSDTYNGRSYVVFSPIPGDQVWVDFADPGAQTGTFDDPFNTIADAVLSVPVDGTIMIKGTGAVDDTSETILINKKLTLNSVGANVAIGTP